MLDALSGVGYALDTPGAYLRGALSGRPGERASGREMLQNWGVAGENQPGLDLGDVGGFAAEMVLDPLSLAAPALGAIKGIGAGTRAARAVAGLGEASPLARRLGELKAGVETPLDAVRHAYRQGESANPLTRAMAGFAGEESGALRPFMEIGRRTDPDYVNSVPWWHGTATPGLTPETLDPMKTDPGGLFGRGIYKTASPEIAGGSGGYAEARMSDAMPQWNRALGNTVMPLISGNQYHPETAARLDESLRGLLESPGFLKGHEPLKKYALETAIDSQARNPGNPGKFSRSMILNTAVPDAAEPLAAVLRSHGIQLPPIPRPTVYEANTNLGKIADLDAPLPPELLDALRGVAEETSYPSVFEGITSRGGPASDLIEAIKPGGGYEVDPMINAFRQAGYDALSHTGGLRAGGGRNLHQVLISLDPNDTISRVGRAGQITRFEPQDIPELLKRFGGT